MNIFTMERVKLLYLFICIPFVLLSQTKQVDIEHVNDLFRKSDAYMFKDDLKSLEYAKEASLLAEKLNDPKLTAKSYLILARGLNYMRIYDKSLLYLDKGLKFSIVKDDVILYQHFKEFKADNFGKLGLFDQELNEYFDILKTIPKQDTRDFKQLDSRINARIAYNYYNQKKYKVALIYINKALKVQEDLSKVEKTSELYNIYQVKGEICLQSKKKDSAYYYFQKAYKIIRKGIEYEYMSLKSFGDYYKTIGDTNKAIDYYIKALQDIKAFEVRDFDYTSEISKNLSELYAIKGNEKGQKLYMEEYKKAIEEGQNLKRKDLQAAVNLILSNQKEELAKENKKNYYWILLMAGIIILFIAVLMLERRIKSRKLQHVEKKALQKEQMFIREKEELTVRYEEDTKKMEKMVNESFEEVFTLAKNNSPGFFIRFQEVYPEVVSELLAKDCKLRVSELRLCAYFFLGFTTKDIALYTFRSINTVRNRRQNLRIKLNIPAEEDLDLWFKNLSKK